MERNEVQCGEHQKRMWLFVVRETKPLGGKRFDFVA